MIALGDLLSALLRLAPIDQENSSFWAGDEEANRLLGILLWLVIGALLVLWFGRKQLAEHQGTTAMRPQGRVLQAFRRMRPPQWRKTVQQLEKKPPTPIAEAKRGPVRLEGILRSASGNLGGAPGRECVWRNREGGRPESAVGADLVFLADDTGKCAIEGLEGAVVIAPPEKLNFHYESVSLYLGDRVEVCGTFSPDKVDDDEDPTQSVYGTLGAKPGLDVRLVERAPPAETSSQAPTPD